VMFAFRVLNLEFRILNLERTVFAAIRWHLTEFTQTLRHSGLNLLPISLSFQSQFPFNLNLPLNRGLEVLNLEF
jgi:hypothetical protein